MLSYKNKSSQKIVLGVVVLLCVLVAVAASILVKNARTQPANSSEEDIYGITPERQEVFDSLKTGNSSPVNTPLTENEKENIFRSLKIR
jgi:hypothetical protein